MLTPKEIIEDIRKNTYGIGLQTDKAAQGVIDNFRISLNSALERLSVDLYTKETHFVLELIQNADDNKYQNEAIPTLSLTIEQGKIIVQNNEIGFTQDNVRAICNVGRSTKTKVEGYIGEKGIGFKSVFRISDKPQIFSNGFQFHFQRQDEQNQLGFVIPYWIEAVPEYVDSTLTNIILPHPESARDDLGKLGEIEHTLILFLRQLKTVIIDDKVNNTSHQITRLDPGGKIEIEETRELIPKKHSYKLFKKALIVPEFIQESKRENVKSTELILAFSLQEDGSADTRLEQKVFAFLPTRTYGFKFLIQADFLVPANREDIHKDTQWNKWIRDNIATTFVLAVEEFKQDSNLQKTYYNYIPLHSEIKDEFFMPVVSEIHHKLKASKCILTESEKWQIPSDVMQVDKQIRDLISNNDLQQLLKKEYIHPDVNAKTAILESLGVKKFSFENLLQCLQNNEWLEKQSDNWFVKLYTYLNRTYATDYSELSRIKKLKIILLENNKLASSAETSIFFPLNLNNTVEHSFELQFIKKTLLESTSKSAVENFLKKLGVQNASCYEIIENHILPIYKGGTWKSQINQLLGYICYIKDNLSEYEKESKKIRDTHYWSPKEDPLKSLKKSLLIKTDTNKYLSPANVYLTVSYGNSNELETLLEGIQGVWFVSSEYIQDLIQIENPTKKAEKIREWKDFLVKLGVHTLPKIDIEIKTARGRSNKKIDYYHEYPIYSSPHIVRILEARNVEKNQKLAKILDRNWDYYKQYKSWQEYYYEAGGFHPYRSSNDADWFTTIKTAAWLPSTKLSNPSEIFLAEPQTVSILGARVPYLAITLNNQDFIKDLGIKDKITEPKDYADLLLALSCKNELDEKQEESVLKIYQELNKIGINSKDWWSKFISEKRFWTNKRTFCIASQILINDHNEIYELFKDNLQIAFLKLPPNYYPQLSHFIKATGIRYVSQIVKTELAIGEVAKVAEESLTEQIKALIPYILRYLYKEEQQIYQRLKTNATLIQLKNLVCYRVEKLQIKYLLEQQSASTQRKAFLDNGNLYIQSDSLSNTDYLAGELSQLFGKPKGLHNFLISLFDKGTIEEIDGLMKAIEIPLLPNEEKQWFEKSNIPLGQTSFIEGSEKGETNLSESSDKIQDKSKLTTITPKDEGDDAEWLPECEPREITEFEAVQWTKTKIPSQVYLSDEVSEKPQLSGIWGEKFAVEYLRRKFSAKYPTGKLEENQFGFSIQINNQVVVEVQWINEIQETVGYDIKLIENGREDYIEVKSSQPGAKKSIKLSGSQWKLADELGENFHIYRVYDAGTQQAQLLHISNPIQLVSEGSLRIDSVYLRI